MAVGRLHSSFGRIFRQRCFYLFISLVFLVGIAPFVADFEHGRDFLNASQVLVLVAAVAAMAHRPMPFVISLLLGVPALLAQLFGAAGMDDPGRAAIVTNGFYLAFYVVAISYLLAYVFTEDVMSDDKLFGAAAGYLMLGIGWAYAYALQQRMDPSAFGVPPGGQLRGFYDLLAMSFGLLTSNGPGDVVVTALRVKALVILEQVVGTLFVAILIARLAGLYPAKVREARERGEL
jgi:hypothetical protein